MNVCNVILICLSDFSIFLFSFFALIVKLKLKTIFFCNWRSNAVRMNDKLNKNYKANNNQIPKIKTKNTETRIAATTTQTQQFLLNAKTLKENFRKNVYFTMNWHYCNSNVNHNKNKLKKLGFLRKSRFY